MPMLTSMTKDMPSSRIGSATAARSLAATSRAAAASLTAGSSTANSSPPSRATRSPGRMLWVSRCATSRSSRSPTAWPSVSLTSFSPRSRSSSRKPTLVPDPLAWASVLSQPEHQQLAVREPGQLVVMSLVLALD